MNLLPTKKDFQLEECYRITCELMEHPCASIFSKPVSKEENPDYFQKITEPMDLGEIRKKLENKEYETYEDWKYDINLVWSNAIEYNGTKSAIGIMVSVIKDEFNKLIRKKIPKNDGEWILSISNLTSKLNNFKKEYKKKYYYVHPLHHGNYEKQVSCFLKAAEKLTEKEDYIQMNRICSLFEKKFNPPFSTDNIMTVCIDSLSVDSIYLLILYAKRRFKELNLEYPNE